MRFDLDQIKFNDQGLVPAIAQDYQSKNVLMLAWMNRDAIRHSLETGRATYWSRSRQSLWVKGETSGNTQTLIEMRLDCDRDAILLFVDQKGPACHTGAPNCFFKKLSLDADGAIDMQEESDGQQLS